MLINEPKKPNPTEFGLTQKRYNEIGDIINVLVNKKTIFSYIPSIVSLVVAIPIFSKTNEISLGFFAIFIIFTITSSIYEYIDDAITSFRIKRIKDYKSYIQFDDALSTYKLKKHKYDEEKNIILKKQELIKQHHEAIKQQKEKELRRKEHEYWMSIDPYEFEKEITHLFRMQGYDAHVTKGSGDGGIDINLENHDGKGIVQCKRHKTKVGPGPIRDLYGTMKAGKYKYAFIVCPSGFSDKAYEFSKGKKIKLIGLKKIMEMLG